MSYLKYHLMKPAAGPDYDYTINDCSVGDVDGDGQYELIVKWEPTNARDNSQGGMTGPVVLDCYKFDMEVRPVSRADCGASISARISAPEPTIRSFSSTISTATAVPN